MCGQFPLAGVQAAEVDERADVGRRAAATVWLADSASALLKSGELPMECTR